MTRPEVVRTVLGDKTERWLVVVGTTCLTSFASEQRARDWAVGWQDGREYEKGRWNGPRWQNLPITDWTP